MRVSVVVCTYNRADGLRETLECLKHQTYPDFEVVVVNGPSTDHTMDVLDEYGDLIRVAQNPLPNLSVSRNLGIRASAGDVVAFIDDDALPEFCWLDQAIPAFDDPEVGGVGGIVFDHTGMDLQYRYSAANRFGEAEYRSEAPYDELSRPGGFLVPYLQGTNALFRRDALARIGLFDETFDYYLDETDVCMRMVDAGWVMRQLSDAPVHHKFLPSHVRNNDRVVTNWYPIVKNMVYFGYRHALINATELEVIERGTLFARRFISDAAFHEEGGRLPPGSGEECERIVAEALSDGITLGRERADFRLPIADLEPPEFLPYPTIVADDRRCWVLVSSGYPPAVSGGIARYVGEVAPALAAMGHEVRVITKGSDGGTVDLEDGVWVHRIDTHRDAPGALADGPDYIDAFASGVVDELERMSGWTLPDLVYGPAWDVEVLGVARSIPVPVGLFLATPLDVIAEQSELLADPASAPTVRSLLELERELFRSADLAHADSEAVLATITERYGDLIDPRRAGVALLGLERREAFDPPSTDARKFLFVGRLEPRKGIGDLLDAFVEVVSRHPDAELVVVGSDGPIPGGGATYTEQFRRDHDGRPVIDQVRFVGRVDDDELERWHEWADCLVLPSLYESFGLTMLHGMLTNRAVISCDVGAIPEVVRHGTDGLLVPPGDSSALAATIERMVDEPGLAVEMAGNGRRRYLEEFDVAISAARLDSLFRRVSLDRSMEFMTVEGPHSSATVHGYPGVEVGLGGILRVADPHAIGIVDLLAVALGETRVAVESGGDVAVTTLVPDRVNRISLAQTRPSVVSVVEGRVIIGGLVVVGEVSIQ